MFHRIFFAKSRAIHMQFLRYFFVGGSAAVVDLLSFTVLVQFLSVHWAIAAFIGYMLGLAWNHVLCIAWVFESRHHRSKEVMMVFLIALGGLLWTWLLLWLMIDIVGIDEIISKMLSQILVLFWNFGMRKFYVFH